MKKCPQCEHLYEDSVLRCPQCKFYLIEDILSDYTTSGSAGRRHVVKPQSPPPSPSPSPTWPDNGQDGGFRPGTQVENSGNTNPENPRSRGAIRPSGIRPRILVTVLRVLIPVLLIILAIVWIYINRFSVMQVIRIFLIGAIAGGGLSLFIVLRSPFPNLNGVLLGAIIGGVLGLILSYNLFEINTGIEELLNGAGPILIMCIGFLFLFRSIRH